MENPLILALDMGTSSVRAALYDADANILPETMVKHERTLDTTDDGGAEIDADVAFNQMVATIDDVLKKALNIDSEIVYAATCSFWHSLMGIDANEKPTTKVLGWADTRSRVHVAQLRKKFDETEVHNRTGARFHPSFWPAKLLWLRKEQPDVFARTAKWISFSDYVALKLFGSNRASVKGSARGSLAGITSISMASATGIFDIRKCEWDDQLIKFLQVRKTNLSEISPNSRQKYFLNRKFSKRWPRLAGTKFHLPIGDGAANNIGARCVKKSKAALMIGTSGAMRVAYRGEPPDNIPDGLWCYRIDRERVIIGGALSDGGGLFRWLKDNLRLDGSDDSIETEIASGPPAGHGLTFLPFLAGERSTGYHEFATGAIIGIKSSTDTIDIIQAALESVAYRFAEIFDQLNEVCKIREIIASGGALRESPVWAQIIADVLGRNLTLPDTREASSRGAVLLTLETIGKIDDIENVAARFSETFMPNRKRQGVYQSARKRHQKFYDHILDQPNED